MDAIVAGRDERPLPLGVMRRGLSYHLEMRTGSRGCKKVHSANFGQDRELVGISHDVARLCILGETKFLGLQKNQLNHWEDRYLIAQKFSGDPRMIGLAEDHRKKDRDHLNWDPGMKKRLHALTLDVHKLIVSARMRMCDGIIIVKKIWRNLATVCQFLSVFFNLERLFIG